MTTSTRARMRVLFACVPQAGHLLPLLPLATAFAAQGDEVTVASGGAVADTVTAWGLEFRCVCEDLDSWFGALAARILGRPGEGLAPEHVERYFVPRLFGEIGLAAVIDGLTATVRDLRPDLLIFEPYTPAAPLVAAQHGIEAVAHTLGRGNDTAALDELPDNAIVAEFLPQAELLPHCAAVVHHAGAGTAFGLLAHGLPSVALPQGADNFRLAGRLAAAGVARVLMPDQVGVPAAAVETLLEEAGPGSPTPLLLVGLRHMGGALSRPPAVEDAICARDSRFLLQTIGVLAGPQAAGVPAAVGALLAAMAPYSTGHTMVNLHGTPGNQTDRARAWMPDVHRRLCAAKAQYDPGNLLRFGHAVAPE